MKARVRQNAEKKILGANLTAETAELLQAVCEQTGAQLVTAEGGDLKRCPAELLGENAAVSEEGEYPLASEPMIMLAGFDRKQLDSVLDLMKAAGIRVPLKAMYTPHNRLWSLDHLIAELAKEHQYMTGGDRK